MYSSASIRRRGLRPRAFRRWVRGWARRRRVAPVRVTFAACNS